MKILYLHGFASSGANGTVDLLRRLLPDDDIVAPDIPVDPLEAMPYLKELCEQEQPDIVLGTSMGGMYAHQLHGFKRICVNPAVNMSTMSGVLKTGEHKFHNGRKDHQKTFRITRDIIQHHNQVERMQFKGLTKEDKENVWGLFGINDTVCHTYDLFHKHYPQCSRFEGEHYLNEKALKKAVLPLIQQLTQA